MIPGREDGRAVGGIPAGVARGRGVWAVLAGRGSSIRD